MSSVFELFGIKKSQPFTPVSQLSINNYLHKLQLESERRFKIAPLAQAEDDNKLAITIVPGQGFDSKNLQHIELLNDSIHLFKDKSSQLKALDWKIASGVLVGVMATSLSFLPLVGALGLLGWGAALYYMNQRSALYTEYHESLTLLVATCNWSLGEGPEHRKNTDEDVTSNLTIRTMMASLYPVLTETQVKHLIADDIEDIFVKELQEYEQKFTLGLNTNGFFAKKDDSIALSKRGAEFERCIYGFNKGSTVDFLDALASFLPDVYRLAQRGVQQVKNSWNAKPAAPEVEAEQQALSLS